MTTAMLWQTGLCIVAVCALGVYAQAGKLGCINGIDRAIGLIQIPLAVAIGALLALNVGWWTTIAFPLPLFLSGFPAASMRRTGDDLLLLSKSWTGPLVVILTGAAWAVRVAA